MTARTPRADRPRFYSVSEAAEFFGTSEMTLYRAIRDGDFPAIRIRSRLIIPARAIEAMVDAAATSGALVDAVEWVDMSGLAEESPPSARWREAMRPRPGADETEAASPITQQRATGHVSNMTHPAAVEAVGRLSRSSSDDGVR